MLTRSFCAATAEHEHAARDAMHVGSAGASPSHGRVLRTGGGGSRRPEPFIQLGFPVAATNLAKQQRSMSMPRAMQCT